ncbi:unspecific monooxygenase [Halarchaeum acidiphilum MH1-52-1]|uniref:Unspecific monooxygenase n=1 Tax=Halarchaeum acidiphilum MH1-52-1 TaxID=1261545 RepID=U2YRJ7_9EURY|nr:cytochrome P450 [Halarchaeum acidiphilum]GAD51327.1 unspecific monooxygenase [Halarchaeum acidiphilum MH1-52-1]
MSESHSRIPGPDGAPVVGNTRAFGDDPLAFVTDVAREYGDVARYDLGTESLVQITDPELIEHVLVQNNQAYEKGERFQRSLRPTLGSGLLTSEGEFWREQRHTVQPAFHPEMLERYADVMAAYTERALDEWRDGEVRNVHADMMRLTVEIAATALLGVDVREAEGAIADALEALMDDASARMQRPVQVPRWLPTPGNRRFAEAQAELNDVVDTIVEEHRAGETAATDDDLLSLLLNATDHTGAPLTDEQIRDEVVTILLAGHETTALALTYTLHALGRDDGACAALEAEVDRVLGERRPDHDDLDALDVTERTVTEGMRLYPPVWQVIREADEPDDLGGYEIDPGTTIGMQQWVVHRDPRWYDDPTDFRPERWTDGFEASLPRFAHFPFGGGPRRCIGDRFAMQEARLALATIVRDWEVDPLDDLSFAPSITLRPDGPVEIRVRRRSR